MKKSLILFPITMALLPACDMVHVQTSGNMFSSSSSNGGTSARPAPTAKQTRVAQREPATQPSDSSAAASPAAQARDDRRAARNNARQTERDAAQLHQDARRILNDLNALAKGDAPIPDAKLAELDAAAAALPQPAEARYVQHMAVAYRLEAAWKQPDNDAAKIIATTLGGEITTSGTTAGAKKLAVTINAEKGVCYTAFLRWVTSTGNEEIKELAFDARGASSPLQEYWAPSMTHVSGEHIRGFCATDKTAATMSADLTFAGTRNGVRYVVLATPKVKFPLYVATYMSALLGDSCDTDAWLRAWADPIPGAIVYSGAEPFMMLSPDRAGQSWNTLSSVTFGSNVRAQKRDLTGAPTGKVKFGTQFKFPGCSTSSPKSADSIRLQRCHAGVSARFDPQRETLVRAKENAPTMGALRQLSAAIAHLDEAAEAEDTRLCDPIEKQITQKWQATYEKIVDLYTDHPYISPIDRAGALAGQDWD